LNTRRLAPCERHVLSRLTASRIQGNFFFGCLRGERIIRVITNGRQVVSQENLLEHEYGRIRDIAEGPDGFIYFSSSNRDGRGKASADDDRILRLVPVK
jgi:glucose/arabinose dehydrogenase